LKKSGNTCPFLDTDSGKKSPHGGFPCKIYKERPLVCMTYPLIELDPITLDEKCKFCKWFEIFLADFTSQLVSTFHDVDLFAVAELAGNILRAL